VPPVPAPVAHAPASPGTAPPVPASPAAVLADLARPDHDLALPAGDEAVVVTGDGARLAATIVGAPGPGLPTVVLPHCWTGSRAFGVPLARRLSAAGHRVVLYDQRGHGESSTGTDPISIDRLGADLAAVVEQLDLRDTVLAGHSMGGMTVMAFACHHAELARARVRGLALVATAAHGLSARGRARFWRTVLSRPLLDRAMVRPRLGNAFVRPTFGVDPVPQHVEATRAHFVATPPDVRLDCAEAMGTMDLRAVLRAVDLPAVVVLGTRDKLIVNGLTRAIAEHIDGAEVIELPGAGHMLPLERPDEVAAVIRRLAG
jgi:pimeloyl-ACP methyl ester carboxylesterase